jgi:predicted nucleic acid-binding protein
MRVALDSNIVLYSTGINDPQRARAAREVLERLPASDTFVPVQVLGEVFRVLTRKAKLKPADARTIVMELRDTFPLIETTPQVLLSAMDLSVDHQVSIWDGVILACAVATDCRVLLSEDLQDGFTWQGLTVVNPFAKKPHSLLIAALDETK